MLLGLEITIFWLLLTLSVYWILRSFNLNLALYFLIFSSIFTIGFFKIFILIFLLSQLFLIFLLYQASKNFFAFKTKNLPWFSFIGLLPINLYESLGRKSMPDISEFLNVGMNHLIWYTGGTFVVIKSYVLLKESIKINRFLLRESLLNLTFIPALPAGPIAGSFPYSNQNIRQFSLKDVTRSVMMMIWGVAGVYIISPELKNVLFDLSQLSHIDSLSKIYLNFFSLYFDFSGYSLIAIASASFFGISLPANFNKPYLATSIRDFWQRWHMSIGVFIDNYILRPFVRRFGPNYLGLGIFLAFIFIGLWHKFSYGYLFWGVAHGAALFLTSINLFGRSATKNKFPKFSKFMNWFLTISFVAFISSIANK